MKNIERTLAALRAAHPTASVSVRLLARSATDASLYPHYNIDDSARALAQPVVIDEIEMDGAAS